MRNSLPAVDGLVVLLACACCGRGSLREHPWYALRCSGILLPGSVMVLVLVSPLSRHALDRLMKHWFLDFWSRAGATTPPNLHPYDGVERVFRHTDKHGGTGLMIVAQLLKVDSRLPANDVLYDLSFYSGGIGVLDNLAITLPATARFWSQVSDRLKASDPDLAAADEAWKDDFLWLVKAEEYGLSPRRAAIQLINGEKRDFQTQCKESSRIAFVDQSDVNDWCVL